WFAWSQSDAALSSDWVGPGCACAGRARSATRSSAAEGTRVAVMVSSRLVAGQASGLGVPAHERLHAPPRVGRVLRELRLLAVEEAVRGARVDRRVVRDARLAAGGLELVDRALRDALVGAAEDRQHGARVAGDRVDGLGAIRPALEPERPAVEPDHAGVPEPAG